MKDKDNFAIYYVVRFWKRIIDLEIIFQLFITCFGVEPLLLTHVLCFASKLSWNIL